MSTTLPLVGADGFYHPANEEELSLLVKQAYASGLEIRVRGSAHSVACAIYTDSCTSDENTVSRQTPPASLNMNVMLDKYSKYRVLDADRMLVEADAGINLGYNPGDPTKTSTLQNSLLYQLWHDHGWTLPDLGGITHQTVSGFTATGSSGGSLTYSINDAIYAMRLIDGQGNPYTISRDDTNPELFNAAVLSMGLLGLISTITFQCVPTFNILGQEAITVYDKAEVDIFGSGSDLRPSLEQFLKQTEYTRLVWWPQRGGERIVIWKCNRIKPEPGFKPKPYQEFTDHPAVAEVAISIFLTIIGNLDNLPAAKAKLVPTTDQVTEVLQLLLSRDLGPLGTLIGTALGTWIKYGIDAMIDFLTPLAESIKISLPYVYPSVIDLFVPLDSKNPPPHTDEPQHFWDYGWSGLPMDNQADDVLVPTEFTEIWLPISRTQDVMNILRAYFAEPKDMGEALARTGTYGWELYGAGPTSIMMSPSYSDGKDIWKDGVFRIDPYWFANNIGNPAEVFYPPLWKLLREKGIPFRLHWAKFQPIIATGDPDGWVPFFKKQYSQWDRFLEIRSQKDPNNIFLTDYWRNRFGLWNTPRPKAGSGATHTTVAHGNG